MLAALPPRRRPGRSSTSSAFPTPRRAGPNRGTWVMLGNRCGDWSNRRALILVENLSVPFDRRVWQESTTLRDAGWEVHVICPQGTKRDTEPEAEIDGVRIHRYPLRAATGGPLGYLREYGIGAVAHAPAGPQGRPGRRGPRLQPAGPALPRRPCGCKRRGARFVFDQHDLVPELYLSRFDRGEDLLYRAVCRAGTARPTGPRTSSSPPTRATGTSRCAAAASGRRTCSWCAARPRSSGSTRCRRTPALKRGKPHLLCYLGVMGPQDGVDYALRALAKLRDEVGPRPTGTRCSSAPATPSTRWWSCPGELGLADAGASSPGASRTRTWCATCPPRTCACRPTRATRSTTCRP